MYRRGWPGPDLDYRGTSLGGPPVQMRAGRGGGGGGRPLAIVQINTFRVGGKALAACFVTYSIFFCFSL